MRRIYKYKMESKGSSNVGQGVESVKVEDIKNKYKYQHDHKYIQI